MRYPRVIHFLLVLFLSSLLQATQATPRIRGRVTDSGGAPIPGAVVTLTGEAISPRSILTSEDGTFVFLSVPTGEYSIKVEIMGFSIKEVHNVMASIDHTVELNILIEERSLPEAKDASRSLAQEAARAELEARALLSSGEVDMQIEQLKLGQVMYNPPTIMTEQTKVRVEVKISQSLTEDLTQGLRGKGIPEVEKVLVGSNMKVTLSGMDFEIIAHSEATQSVFTTGSTLWEWDVIPQKAGKKTLYVSIAVLFDTKYGQKAKSYPVLEREIAVKVNPKAHPFDWIQFLKNVAVVLGIVATLIGIITAILKAVKKKQAGGH
jgi:hypothetical protein